MNYMVKENENTTITIDGEKFEKWSTDNIYNSPFTLAELVDTLKTVEKFKSKYFADKTIFAFDEIVRSEICQIFGGELNIEY